MVEVKLWQTSIAKNQRFFTKERIFFLVYIIKKAHVVPIIATPVQYWFVNNYVNCDQLNTLYNKNFEAKETRARDKIVAQFK